jgi:hypothetical protein
MGIIYIYKTEEDTARPYELHECSGLAEVTLSYHATREEADAELERVKEDAKAKTRQPA